MLSGFRGRSGTRPSPVSDAVWGVRSPLNHGPYAVRASEGPFVWVFCWLRLFGPVLIVLYSSSTLRILVGNQVLQSHGSGHGEAVSLHEIEDLFTANNPPVLRLGALGIVGLL